MRRSIGKCPPAAGKGGSGGDDSGFALPCRSAATGCVTAAREDGLTRRFPVGSFARTLCGKTKVFWEETGDARRWGRISDALDRRQAVAGPGLTTTPAAATSATPPLLEVCDVALRFGGIVALDGVSFTIEPGQILGLIGPNGAGKTTLFNCVSRLYTPNRGDILFHGRSIIDRPPHRLAEIGIGRTFQNLALFAPQSVLDNVRLGAHAHSRSDFVSDALRLPWVRREEARLTETAWSLIRMLDLEEIQLPPAPGLT